MKRVSLKVARALKEAGYPQGNENTAYYNENGILVKPNVFNGGTEITNAPTYLEAWLWLWREKRFPIDAEGMEKLKKPVAHNMWENDIISKRYDDPKEAIIAVIDYLCEKNLIK